MNTEAMNALKQVREGINVLQIELNEEMLSSDERSLLAEALVDLEELEDSIINNVLADMVEKINASNSQLKALITEMKGSTERIARLGNIIKKVSDAAGVLAEITSKAISAGLL